MAEEEKQVVQEQQAQASPTPKKSSKKIIFIILGVILGLFIVGGIVLGAGVFFIYKGAKNKVEQEGIKYKGGQIGGDVKKPSSWPGDVPIYEGTLKYANSNKDNLAVSVSTADSDDVIIEYYEENLKNEGWKLQNETSSSGNYAVSYTKSNKITAVSIVKDSSQAGNRLVTIMITSYKQ